MPQKKNPDSLELLRGKCGRVFGDVRSFGPMNIAYLDHISDGRLSYDPEGATIHLQ